MSPKATLIAALFLLSTLAQASDPTPPDRTIDGLERVPDSKVGLLYVQPGADLIENFVVYSLHIHSGFVCCPPSLLPLCKRFMRIIEAPAAVDLSDFSTYLWHRKVNHRIFEESGKR